MEADVETEVAAAGVPKKRTFKKFSFRGVDLDALLDMSTDELVKLFPARARRRFQRGLKRKPMALIKKLRKAVKCVEVFKGFYETKTKHRKLTWIYSQRKNQLHFAVQEQFVGGT
ncbi:40S ribosomal protein S15 [Gossypium arboreum]|uniref:40S ribosomal protein S15 n=1 Tax=Gossypium arboreum TaxID=29729 RepID=UPI000819390A|nr:40S ribosomal protein S15 [Gossypium arboreum]